MKKGGVPVPYIIAVVLGIVVIGVIGYWFFVTSGKFGGTIGSTECQAKILQWCINEKIIGKDWKDFAPNCGSIPDSKKCQELTGTGTGGGTGGGAITTCSQIKCPGYTYDSAIGQCCKGATCKAPALC